jgi:hypothetical protein
MVMFKILISAVVGALVLAGCHKDSHGESHVEMVRTAPPGTMGMKTPQQPILPDGPGSRAIEPEPKTPGAGGPVDTGSGNPK